MHPPPPLLGGRVASPPVAPDAGPVADLRLRRAVCCAAPLPPPPPPSPLTPVDHRAVWRGVCGVGSAAGLAKGVLLHVQTPALSEHMHCGAVGVWGRGCARGGRDASEGKGPQRRPQDPSVGGCRRSPKRFGAVPVGYKRHRGWLLASGGQWLGIAWAPWRGVGGVTSPPSTTLLGRGGGAASPL